MLQAASQIVAPDDDCHGCNRNIGIRASLVVCGRRAMSGVTEQDVGITEFATQSVGFSGILKHRCATCCSMVNVL